MGDLDVGGMRMYWRGDVDVGVGGMRVVVDGGRGEGCRCDDDDDDRALDGCWRIHVPPPIGCHVPTCARRDPSVPLARMQWRLPSFFIHGDIGRRN
jgi:hypothetical protein